jgi:hypothetical protein
MKVLAVMDETNEHSVSGGAPVASSSTRQSKRHRCYINRDCEAVHFRLRHDYFDDDYVYPLYFCLRYHMWMFLFLSIMHNPSEISPCFSESYDATGGICLTTL